MVGTSWGDIYRELGATPIINAIGSVTMLGGSTPIREVKEAMERADSAYIPLMELEEKAGKAIAEMLNAGLAPDIVESVVKTNPVKLLADE